MFETDLSLFMSKFLPVFLYPTGAAATLTLLGAGLVLLGRRRSGLATILTAAVLLWASATPFVAEWIAGSLERQHPARAISDTPEAEVAIVLGGAIRPAATPRQVPDFGEAGDRVIHAARLFRAGKVKRILITGGNIPWLPGTEPEALMIRDHLVEFGVPTEAITLASQSRNTYENALEIKELRGAQPFKNALLVTSALHMPRAIATFQKVGIPVIASTTDVRVISKSQRTIFDGLPDSEYLDLTTKAVKEWIGFWAYWMRGYL
jgi:uncharacterized SAM-binding protein YcdF (DUF218 family)